MRTAGDSGRICYACRMLRALAALVLMAAPAQAWEAGSGEVCELSHDGETASVAALRCRTRPPQETMRPQSVQNRPPQLLLFRFTSVSFGCWES